MVICIRWLLARGLLLFLFVSIGIPTTLAAGEDENLAKATFAGGCFWCMEPPYDTLEGVASTTVGYTGGHTENPSYAEVSSGKTGHVEAVQVVYNPNKISYAQLLDNFWRNIDPLASNQQFCDKGSQYRSVIFYHNEEQQRLAEASKANLDQSGHFDQPITTEIKPATEFYAAEAYHQNYYQRKPIRYKLYRFSCGRDHRLKELWGQDAG